MHSSARFLSLSAVLLGIAACTSVDAERRQMNASVANASRLATEVASWRSTVSTTTDSAVVDSIKSFQHRADDIIESLTDLSAEATAGTDFTGLKQALQALTDFDTATYAPASPNARTALLNQFAGLAKNLQDSIPTTRG